MSDDTSSVRPINRRTPEGNFEANRAGGSWGWFAAGLLLLVLMAIGLMGGPALGEHETIVALIARQTLQAGQWLIPHCTDTPFLIKPPLTPWLIAAASKVMPANPADGLPVTDISARIPSALATLLTILIVFKLARSMLGVTGARVATFVYATSVGTWLFAANATAEALLTLFCTWAFAEFWWAMQADAGRRRMHLLRFYVAFGLAMLAKGPMPLSMVGFPIAVYWWADRPLRALAAGGPRAAGSAAWLGVRQALPRLRTALTRLGLWWGVPIFLLMFLPWMLYVARLHPYVWSLWNFEYLKRLHGEYPGEGQGGFWYYIPILFGLVFPWSLSLPEALAAPFLSAYRHRRRALMYLWFWALTGLAVMSSRDFKKPYYILPALPACALLLAPVLQRLFLSVRPRPGQMAKIAVGGIIGILVVVLVVGNIIGHHKYPDAWQHPVSRWAIPACGLLLLVGFGGAGLLFIRQRYQSSLATIGLTAGVMYALGWCAFGPAFSSIDEPMELVKGLEQRGISRDVPLYWISNRPDTRVVFYGGRPVRHVMDTYKLVAEQARSWNDDDIKLTVASKAVAILKSGEPTCIVFQRGQWAQFQKMFNPPAEELFDVQRGRKAKAKSDLVVISNARPRLSQQSRTD